MPKVTQYQPNQVATQVSQQPTLRLNTDNGNTKIANAIGNVASTLIDTRNKVEVSRAEDAFNQYNNEVNRLKFNPENGYFNTEGINAVDGVDNFNKELIKLKENYSKSLNSQVAKSAFSRSADTLFNRTQEQVMKHASRGQRVYEQSVILSRIENAKENIALNWNDEKEINLYRAVGRDAILDRSEKEGLSPEATAEEIQSFESEAATAIIESAISSSSVEGENALKKYGDSLEGNLGRKLKTALDKKINAEKEQDFSAQTMIQASAIVANSENRKELISEVNKIKDVKLRKSVMREADYQFNKIKQAESEERLEIFDDVSKLKNDGGNINEFITQNPDSWDKLTAKQQQQLISGSEDNPDFLGFTNFMSLPNETIKAMSNEEIEDVLLSFPKSLRDDISRKVVTARKGTFDDNIPSYITSTNKVAIERIFGQGVLGNNKANDNIDKKLKANQFLRFVNEEYLYRKSQKGSDLTANEYDDLVDDVTRKAITDEGLIYIFNSKSNIDELETTSLNRNTSILRQLEIEVNADTLFETENIIEELEKRNLPVTLDNIKTLMSN